jgi:hypothetical protein
VPGFRGLLEVRAEESTDCMDFKRVMLSEPNTRSAELVLHAGSCEKCARYAEDLRAFEDRLKRALRVELAESGAPLKATVIPLRPRNSRAAGLGKPRRGWWAAAASVLLAVGVTATLWFVSGATSLAADVVGHMAGEPNAWAVTQDPVPQNVLDTVLEDSHVRLKQGAGMVSYAQSCEFRGHRVPHLVVQTDQGPVTVMLLTHENVHGVRHFDEHGYRGIIVALPDHGSLAVIQRGPGADTKLAERVAAQVEAAVDWTA